MKKTLLILALAMLTVTSLLAQEGKISYTDYNSDGEIIYTDYGAEGWSYQYDFTYEPTGWDWTAIGVQDTFKLDLDFDGELDCYFHVFMDHELEYIPYSACVSLRSYRMWYDHPYLRSCEYAYYHPDYPNQVVQYYQYTIGDTISNLNEFGESDPHWNPSFGYEKGPLSRMFPRYIAFRIEKDAGWCYGWMETNVEYTNYPSGHGGWEGGPDVGMPKVTLYRWAYCNIPNYPLRLGQTSFEWGVKEDNATAFASLYPNPTTGQVTVTGKNLQQIEVVNLLGQCMATVAGDGDVLHIDMANLPKGVYFVNITDAEGRTCVRKVVKE